MEKLLIILIVLLISSPCYAIKFMTGKTVENLPAYMEQDRRRGELRKEKEQDKAFWRAYELWQDWDDHSRKGFWRFVKKYKVDRESAMLILDIERSISEVLKN